MKNNRLLAQRCYLAGAMDRVADRGVGWRDDITPYLEKLGVVVFNPLKKPTDIGMEDHETHSIKTRLKAKGKYDELAHMMKTIRAVDLRLVDISDFLVVNLDLDVHPCGTYEELFVCNRSKKPIVVRVVQGKGEAPDWLFGTIPHNMIFSEWDEVKGYLKHINQAEHINDQNRWRFFTH
jgi:hypothetical protein